MEPRIEVRMEEREAQGMEEALTEIMEVLLKHEYMPERISLEGEYASRAYGIGFAGKITIQVVPKNGKNQLEGADI